MTPPLHQFDLSLAHKAMFSVSDASGVHILCREGALWVTLDDDPRDVVLEPGESFLSTQHRRALIYALAASSLTLAIAPAATAAAPAQRTGPRRAAPEVRLTLGLQPAC